MGFQKVEEHQWTFLSDKGMDNKLVNVNAPFPYESSSTNLGRIAYTTPGFLIPVSFSEVRSSVAPWLILAHPGQITPAPSRSSPCSFPVGTLWLLPGHSHQLLRPIIRINISPNVGIDDLQRSVVFSFRPIHFVSNRKQNINGVC